MLNQSQIAKLKSLIKDYAETMVADSWAGSADPEDYENIRGNHKEAEEKMLNYLAEITINHNEQRV